MRVIMSSFCIMMALSFGFARAAESHKENNVKSSAVLSGKYDENKLLASGSGGHVDKSKQTCTCGETQLECSKG